MFEQNSRTGFWDRFGENDDARLRKRAELAKEYEEFKRIDEEKFKNRFADKKKASFPLKEGTSEITNGDTYEDVLKESSNEKAYPERREKATYAKSSDVPSVEASTYTAVDLPSLQSFEDRITRLAEKIDLLYEDRQANASSGNLNQNHNCSNTGSTKERLRTNDESLTPDQMKMYERELQMRLSLIKDAEERLFAIEKEYMQTKQTSNEDIRAFESTTQKIKSDSRRHFASPGYYPLPIEREMSPKSKYYKQQLYREELEKQILEAKKKKMAQENALAIRETTSKDSTLVFDGKNSPPKDIKINYVLDYFQSSPSDQNYFAYGQNDLVKSSSPLPPLSTSFAEEANADLGCADYQVQCNKQFPNSQNSKKVLYAQELRQQIEEARRKKELQKRKDEEFDRKIEEESAKYDPFDLNITQGHLKHAPTVSEQKARNGEDTFARGGHGIFGSPLTSEQKISLQKYKDDLAQQIAEKKRAAEMEKQKELELEKKEAERLAADQLRMRKEYEEEQARLRAKQEEAERFAEQQRKEVELRKKAKLERLEKLQEKANDGDSVRSEKQEDSAPKRRTKQKKQKERLKSPELLIGPERTSKCTYGSAKTTDQESNPIINQLKTLRSQLDVEKQRIEDALAKSRTERVWGDSPFSESAKTRPKMVKKGSDLFTQSQISKGRFHPYIDNSGISSWTVELMKDENRARIEQDQASYLRAQDNYLTELKEDLNLLSLQEMKNDRKLNELLKENATDQTKHASRSSSLDPDEKPPDFTPRAVSLPSLSIEQLAAKNEQRLKRLDAMQLLNDIDADPEAVLQRFIEKHEEVHSMNPRFPCY